MPDSGYFRWCDYKVIYDVTGFQGFADPEKLSADKCRELYIAIQNGNLKFIPFGIETNAVPMNINLIA
jgi:hypothetical protein